MRRIEIEFADTNIMHGWDNSSAEDFLATATAMGYFKSEDDEQITITMAVSTFGLIFEKLSIPKGAIKSIKELRLK